MKSSLSINIKKLGSLFICMIEKAIQIKLITVRDE